MASTESMSETEFLEHLCASLEDDPYLHLFMDSYVPAISTLKASMGLDSENPCIVIYYNKLNKQHNLPFNYHGVNLVYKHLDFSRVITV
jgi:hypothetical protein